MKPGWLSSDYAMFLCETQEKDGERHKVQRKDGDFYFLRKVLRYQFPHVIVPPLPKVNNKLYEKVLNKRMRLF